MARTNFKSVGEYIASQPAALRAALRRVRTTIRKALPGAKEVISYQMPAYRLPGGPVVCFAGWKEHYALYGATAAVVEALGDELAAYELSKGTIRFPLSRPVPVRLIARIAKLRAKGSEGGEKAKARRRGGRARRFRAFAVCRATATASFRTGAGTRR